MHLSNYPPGHPTGTNFGDETRVFYCEGCNRLWTPEDPGTLKLRLQLKHSKPVTCPSCDKPMDRASCERCDEPATHIDTDRAVNAHAAYCSKHSMGRW